MSHRRLIQVICVVSAVLLFTGVSCKKKPSSGVEKASSSSSSSAPSPSDSKDEAAKDSDGEEDTRGVMEQDTEEGKGFSTYVQIPPNHSTGMLGVIDSTLESIDEVLSNNPEVGEVPADLLSGWQIEWCDSEGCSGAIFRLKELNVYKGDKEDKPDPEVWKDHLRHTLVHLALGGANKHKGHHKWMRQHKFCYVPERCKGIWQPMSE